MSRNTVVKRGTDDITLTRSTGDITIQYEASVREMLWIHFQQQGVLSTGVGSMRYYIGGGYTIETIRVSVGAPCSGTSIVVDVNRNGTTLFTNQANRPTIAQSTYTTTATPTITTLTSGDYLTVDIDQVGSTVAGSNLLVQIELTQ